MTDKIKAHIDRLLQDAPKTRRIEEMREELLSGCLDKYEDLTASGISPEDAFAAVISGIGDVDELIKSLSKENVFDPAQAEKRRRKKALLIGCAIMLFVFALTSIVIFDELLGLGDFAIVPFFTLGGLGAALIVYANMTQNAPKYEKREDTIVEEVKVSMNEGSTQSSKESRLRAAASSSLWSLIVLVYLSLGFLIDWWHPGWVIFPFGVCLQSLLNAALTAPGKRTAHLTSALIAGAVSIYLLLGAVTDNARIWGTMWLIIPLAIAIQQISRLVRIWRDES
ncbi:MAG: permease prefix domain 1-containing protein [Oscillospiraceae bacterium]|jgi:hypothetical protein|nr:permease prefix domain 1-containing protein [Oscillospiraceae bacterium]